MNLQRGFAPTVLTVILLMALTILALSSLTFGQANQGAIAGVVEDSSGAVVAGAKLTATERSPALSMRR